MKPAPLRYLAVHTVDDALAALVNEPDARLLAGGQSLMPMMNLRVARPATVIDINGIDALCELGLHQGRLRCGALVRHEEVAHAEAVLDWQPLLAHLAGSIGYYPIRQRGTLGGSLANADPAAQYLLAATLLNPDIEVRAAQGTRRVRGRSLAVAPYETVIGEDEMIIAVDWPVQTLGEGWGAESVQQRAGDYMVVASVVTVALDAQERLARFDVAVSGLGAMPLYRSSSGGAWSDAPDECAALALTVESLLTDAAPTEQRQASAYRIHLAQLLTRKALRTALARARASIA